MFLKTAYGLLSLVRIPVFVLQYEIQDHVLIMGKLVAFSKCSNESVRKTAISRKMKDNSCW